MKKNYTKPEIVFENFLASTNIAAGCEVKTNMPSVDNCAYSYTDEFAGQLNLFLADVNLCTDKEADGYNGFCYHVPFGENIFNS